MSRRYAVVDVFTATPLMGNPLAVVLDAQGLDDAAMQRLARWTNLSETTFLLPPSDPTADYRVRIFTPGGELPFAGHPTLGSAFAWLAHGGQARHPEQLVQQCGVGLVRVRRQGQRLAFAAPPTVFEPVDADTLARVVQALGVPAPAVRDAAWMTNGPRQLTLLLDSAATVLALRPDHHALSTLTKVAVVGPHPPGAEAQFEVRFFTAPVGIAEDPVTGSVNAKVAQWLIGSGRAPRQYVAAQGTAMGRCGRITVSQEDDGLWVGGEVQALVRGEIAL